MGPLCNSVLFRFLGRIRYCRIGKKVESQRALRPSWGPKGPLSPRQMCTQKEWKTRLSDVKQWKRLQTSVISAKRHNNSFQPLSLWSLLFSHNTTLYHHFWRSYLATCPLVNPNGIAGKLVTMVTPWWQVVGVVTLVQTLFSPLHLPPMSFTHSAATTLLVIIYYCITQTASGHQSLTEHAQNGLIILTGRAISPSIISLIYGLCSQCEAYFTQHFIKPQT